VMDTGRPRANVQRVSRMASVPPTPLAFDGAFWRRFARAGARSGPRWWLHYSPPVFGWAAALALPAARRRVVANLHRIRGPASPLRDALDTARTFGAYAGCLAESLAAGSKNVGRPNAEYVGRRFIDETAEAGKGIVMATIHTGGWEIVGALFQQRHDLDLVMAMEQERDPAAQAVHDEARRAAGGRVVRIGGDDPLSSLPLLRHLQRKGVVALQIDRVPEGMRSRSVRLLDRPGRIPEGPLRLAALSGAPLLPVFCARVGFREYLVEASRPIYVRRRATPEELDEAAQAVADAMTTFLRKHPTQWFDFGKQEP
jgi:phosphatidylinositol dimannoside acyltransferase